MKEESQSVDKQILDYLIEDRRFSCDEVEPLSKRFYLSEGGKKVAYVWFKYALGGWNIHFYDNKGATLITSVSELKELITTKPKKS